MNSADLLYWALITVSLFNLILLLWLALTVLLNAERRHTLVIWLAGGGLLVGGAFFLCHTVLLVQSVHASIAQIGLWWFSVWASIIFAPYAWYTAMLWHAGFQLFTASPLRRRQLPWFALSSLFALALLWLLISTSPFTFNIHDSSRTLAGLSIPLLVLLYPFFSTLCIVLSLDSLCHPGAPSRMMGELARRRALPWLAGASITLLLVSLVVAWAFFWMVRYTHWQPSAAIGDDFMFRFSWFDLCIETLVGIAVVLIGQAIASYEIFTGMTLPRHALMTQWRRVFILAVGYSVLVGFCLAMAEPLVYVLILITTLMVGFVALAGQRAYIEREHYIRNLRPFVTSQRIYDALLTGSPALDDNTAAPFRTLCAEVLGARVAYLAAVGSFAPLVGSPLAFPADHAAPSLGELITRCTAARELCLPVEPARYGGAAWAVPLHSERGLIGLFLLGEKRDGGLYTQEEMEIARAGGERLLDTRASASMAQRLMALQRQRLAETQVADHRTRRLLHDDILPRLHTAMLTMSAAGEQPALAEGLAQLADAHRQISNLLREMPTATPEVARLGLLGALRQLVDTEFPDTFTAVSWQVASETERLALPPLTAEVCFYAAREVVRNAARYACGGDLTRPLHLRIAATCTDGMRLLIEDDGIGAATANTSHGGSGQGLALHSTLLAVVGGELVVESVPGQYTRVVLSLPVGE